MGLKWDWERGRVTRGKGEKKRDDESNCPVRPRSDCNVVPASHPFLSFLSFPADPVPVFSFLSSSRGGKRRRALFLSPVLKKGFACLLLCVATDRLAATHPKIILLLPLSPLSSTSSFAVSPIIYCSSSFFCFFGAFCVIVGHTFVPFLPSTRDPIKERYRLL